MMKQLNNITYIVGDATSPVGEGYKIIAHIVNDMSIWGGGFVLSISRKWKKPESEYRRKSSYELGTVDYITVEREENNIIIVANMVAQHSIGLNENKDIPLRYSALVDCLRQLNNAAVSHNATIHMPRIGSGLAGGNWFVIEQIIREIISQPVYIYDMPIGRKFNA